MSKKSWRGAPVELNYLAMVLSLVACLIERIPTIKDLVKRLRNDLIFRLDCGFLVSDDVPSEASFSRLIARLADTDVLLELNNELLLLAIEEDFVMDENVAIDASHFDARDRAVPSEKKPRPEPKSEKEQYDQERQAIKEAKTLFERTIQDQLAVSVDELRAHMPTDPAWGIKVNSEGKNVFWFGYKAHLAVGTDCQYILQYALSSGNLNDGKAAITLLKGLEEMPLSLRFVTMDAGYDSPAIYRQVLDQKMHAIIAYNRRRETDIRKYTAPARGSQKWKSLFRQRTAVERVNAYLKEYFQLNNVRHRTGKKAKLHLGLITLVYNASKLAADRIQRIVEEKTTQTA